MKTDNANSGPDTGTTSAAARPMRPTVSPDDEAKAVAKAGVGEAAYLNRQAQLAQQAISRAMSDATALAGQAVDPRRWARDYPWATLGATLVAGFAAAAMVVPSKEQQALKKLAAIERALNPPPPYTNGHGEAHAPADGSGGEKAYKSGKQSFTRTLLGELLGALRPAIVSLATAGVTAAAAKTSPEDLAAATGNPPPQG